MQKNDTRDIHSVHNSIVGVHVGDKFEVCSSVFCSSHWNKSQL